MTNNTILIIGTYDTKSDELNYIAECIRTQHSNVVSMDVSVLGEPTNPCDISKHEIASAAGTTIQAAIDSGEENLAMQIMARGASQIATELAAENRIDGVLMLGGSMGTDLALDVCQALPLDLPKVVVSTIAFSPLIPAHRLSPNVQMILWAGGLYGLNAICKSSLSQAAGAVLGAARTAAPIQSNRPVVGMTSLGSSCLSYMKLLKPALEERGFEVAIFHATGMGGMAFEKIASRGGFSCVMDFALSELGNLLAGSVAHAGEDRLLSAGRARIPQIVAPGCLDLIDFAGWQELPDSTNGRPFHAHNRLIQCCGMSIDERRQCAREIAKRLAQSPAPAKFILPLQGIEAWDKPSQPAYDPEGLAAFIDEVRISVAPMIDVTEVDAHINDQAFADTALAIFDAWVADGTIDTRPTP
ncbi:MAG: Tm-1-like ATP-binding domain-containing protein [Burkholderiaceae bacterium]